MEKAFHHLHKAADADNAYAWYRLGRLYLSDEYKDIGRAVRYLTLAANRKNEFASYRLGKLYLAGEEVVKNVELAIRYLEESAGVGNQYAQYVLGKVNLMGREVEQDKEKHTNISDWQRSREMCTLLIFWNTGMICPIRIYY